MNKKVSLFVIIAALLFPINSANAQEWKRYQTFVDATGNSFAAPMREYYESKKEDSYTTMPCTSEPIHPMVVVTAAHCIWGIYGDKGNAYAHNGGTIWIQEPGKKADDPTAKRVKVLHVFRPNSLGNSTNFPTATVESQDDIAFLVLESPIVSEIKHKIATLEQIKFAMDNKIKMRVYGYGLNSISETNAYYSTPQNERYSVSNQLNPKRFEYDFVSKLEGNYPHHIGFPKMVLAKLPVCGAVGTSGSPAVIEVNGEELLIGPGSHSTGWDCPELKDYSEFTAKNDPFYKNRNTFSHIIIANYPDLIKKSIDTANELMPKTTTPVATPTPSPTPSVTPSPNVSLEPQPKPTATPTPTPTSSVNKNVRVKKTIKCIKQGKVVYATSYNPRCPKGYSLAKN